MSIELQPGEVQIWHLSQEKDTNAPKLEKLYAEDNKTLRVQTSEHVQGASFEVTVGDEKIALAEDAVKAYADLKTFDITLPKAYRTVLRSRSRPLPVPIPLVTRSRGLFLASPTPTA